MAVAQSETLLEARSLAQIAELSSTSKLALVHFWASWCEPCQQMDSVLLELAKEHQGLSCMRVEAEAVDDASMHYAITSVPTVVLIQGGVEVGRVEGADPASLAAAVRSALGSTAQPANKAPQAAAPTPGGAEQDTSVEGRIKFLLASHPVCLFMKGTVEAPRCGFSGRVVRALQALQAPIHGVDILADEPLRAALKAWSNWPTYPQLYVAGELVGGCDIVEEMQASGELKTLLDSKLTAPGGSQPQTAAAAGPAVSQGAAAQVPASTGSTDLNTRLRALVQQQPVMLFMKGTPDEPRCGFSRKVAAALAANQVPFGHFDILADEAVRAGLKEFSNWPTFPQLYVAGELLGGCDIVLQMQEAGELKTTIDEALDK